MPVRKLLSIFCAAVVLVSSAGILVITSRDNMIGAAELEKRFAWAQECLENPNKVVSGLTGKRYKDNVRERTLCAAESVANVSGMVNVRLLVDGLIERSQRDEEFRSACHDILHEVGRYAWLDSSEESLIQGYDTCGMGYYHGAMTSALAEGKQQSNLNHLLEFCEELAFVPGSASKARATVDGKKLYDPGKNSLCMHGIGHALAGVVKSIQNGAELCSDVIVYSIESDPSVCFTGFMNEYLVLNPPARSTPAEAVSQCDETAVTGSFIKQCVKYMLAFNDIKSSEAREYCMQQNEEWVVRGCWSAVGWVGGIKELMIGENAEKGKALLKDPKGFATYVETVCAGDKTSECMAHLFSEVGQVALDTSVMEAICRNLTVAASREGCLNTVGGLSSVQDLGSERPERTEP
jgi:hypothetical protein